MSDLKQARHLLLVAEEDMTKLRAREDPSIFIDRMFGSVVQQVAEKCLKAWICLSGQTYPFTHDLNALLRKLSAQGEDMECFEDLVEYTDYAGELRYQPADLHAAPLDRESGIALVGALLEKVQSLAGKAET